jgi:hypothetical protein
LSLDFYVNNFHLTESFDSTTITTAFNNDILPTTTTSALTNLTIFNDTLSLLIPSTNAEIPYEDDFSEYSEENVAKLGLTQADFLGLFPSESLSKLDHSAEANTFSDVNLIHSLPTDQLDDYANLEAVKSQYHSSVPLRKLQYPEPFIASASFIHTDIGFIHVLQYNY